MQPGGACVRACVRASEGKCYLPLPRCLRRIPIKCTATSTYTATSTQRPPYPSSLNTLRSELSRFTLRFSEPSTQLSRRRNCIHIHIYPALGLNLLCSNPASSCIIRSMLERAPTLVCACKHARTHTPLPSLSLFYQTDVHVYMRRCLSQHEHLTSILVVYSIHPLTSKLSYHIPSSSAVCYRQGWG